jgi:hypothetical protein
MIVTLTGDQKNLVKAKEELVFNQVEVSSIR